MGDRKFFFKNRQNPKQGQQQSSSSNQSEHFDNPFEVLQPPALVSRVVPKVNTFSGFGRNRSEGNNAVGDSSTISDDISNGSYEEFDQANLGSEERDQGSSYSADQGERRVRLSDQQPTRVSSSLNNQKRVRSNISISSDDTKAEFKPPTTFSADAPPRRLSQLNARPSTGIPSSRNARLQNQSPASQTDATPAPAQGDELITSIVQNSALLGQHFQHIVNQHRFQTDQLTSSKEQLLSKLEKVRRELESKKLEVIQVNNHLQAQKRINDIYQTDIEGLNEIKEKLLHGIRQTNERVKVQGEKIEGLAIDREHYAKEKEKWEAEMEQCKKSELEAKASLDREIEKSGTLQNKLGEAEAKLAINSETVRTSATRIEDLKAEVEELKLLRASLTAKELAQRQIVGLMDQFQVQYEGLKAASEENCIKWEQSQSRLTEQLGKHEREMVEAKTAIEQVKFEVTERDNRIQALQAELTEKQEAFKQQYALINRSSLDFDNEKASLQSISDEKCRVLEAEKSRIESEFAARLQQSQLEKSEFESTWKEKLGIIEAEKQKLCDTIASQNGIIEKQAVFNSASKISSIEASLEMVLASVGETNRKLSDENAKLIENTAVQVQEITGLKASLVAMNEQLQGQTVHHDCIVKTFEKSISDFQTSIADLQKKLDDLTSVSNLEKLITSNSMTKQESFDDKPVLKSKAPGKPDFVSSDELPTARKVNPRSNARPKTARKPVPAKSKVERNDSLDLFDAPY